RRPRAPLRSSGCAPTWRQAASAAPSRTGITRCSSPPVQGSTLHCSHCGTTCMPRARSWSSMPTTRTTSASRPRRPTARPPPPPPPPGGVTLVGAGDIANCSSTGDEATAALLDGIQGTVYTSGDNVYPSGSSSDFANCYTPTWGRHKSRTRPTPGIHDYNTSGASAYFSYFGSAAGTAGKGYYSYD